MAEGVIYRDEFENKKSRWFAFTRKDEDPEDLSSHSTNGIGNSKLVGENTISFSKVNEFVSVGDKLIQNQSGIDVEIGIISSIDKNTIGFSEFQNQPVANDFCYAVKNSRVEGGDIRGYYCRVDLENDDTDFVELFAVNSNAVESYV